MTIYIVIGTSVQYFDNDLCWEDGYYDDYYETEVESKEFIGAYLTKEQAEKVVDEVENKNAYDYVNYFPYELEEESKENEQV